MRREENPVNRRDTSQGAEITRLTCRVCYCDITFPPNESVPCDFEIVGSIVDPPKRIIFLHGLRAGITDEELQFHLNLCCQENDQIEKIQVRREHRYAFVQIKDPHVAARLVGIGKFLDSTLHNSYISYARTQSPLVTKSLFVVLKRVGCGPGGMLPLTPFLLYQIFHHFPNIRKIITLGLADGLPQKHTKALIELASCSDSEKALSYGTNLRVELSGHDLIDIQISMGKNEEIQNSTNSPSSMVLTESEEHMLRWHYPPLERTLSFPAEAA
ncbi:RNA-binding protein [Perkinsela sp. CCAP 1560/4]|nr:RNA-binding protein [Perkinsela sp. CCAP 1560/4]|eukprot:KNH09483.1 RNA-binding protein [Perkinsela sp. CCAP 1560/4]